MLRNPRLFAFLLLSVGGALAIWYGEQWWRLPPWNEAEIEQSVELNLALDLRRRGPHLQPDAARLDALRASIRAEVEAEVRREREELERWMAVGLVLMVLGAGQLVFSRAFRPAP